ncbi:MAG: class I SAM-dependent methyltransferase [Solirubrobacterales bacterium]
MTTGGVTAKTDVADARRAVDANPRWYHTIEVAPEVVTPGLVDLRRIAPKLLPADLSGTRALDCGTFDGFWAFELERRGAEVAAIDVEKLELAEWPPLRRPQLERKIAPMNVALGQGFRIAAGLLGSNVRRYECNIYDLSPGAVGGEVDLAFCGALLQHLRDPVRALERILTTMRPGGQLIACEQISLLDTLRAPRTPVARFSAVRTNFSWWIPNYAALWSWLVAAGFQDVRRLGVHRVRAHERSVRNWVCGVEATRPSAIR